MKCVNKPFHGTVHWMRILENSKYCREVIQSNHDFSDKQAYSRSFFLHLECVYNQSEMRVNDTRFLFVTEQLSAVGLPGSHGELELEQSERRVYERQTRLRTVGGTSAVKLICVSAAYFRTRTPSVRSRYKAFSRSRTSTDRLFEFEISPKKSGFAALSLLCRLFLVLCSFK